MFHSNFELMPAEAGKGYNFAYMKKAVHKLCLILKEMLFIGFSVQIVLGLVWMVFHFVEVQEFVQVETGIYPLFVRLLGRIPQVLYLSQLGAAFGAGWLFLGVIRPFGRIMRVWCILALLTLPMALQCHLALLPYSFVSSLTLLELGFCIRAARSERGLSLGALAKAGLCLLGLVLLLPEYGRLGMIPLALTVIFALKALWKQPRQILNCCLLVAAFCGIIGGIGSLTRTEEEGFERHFWFSVASRTAWPTLWNDSERWSEELWAVTNEVLWETSIKPVNMERVLRPVLEDAVGVERATEYYREMAEISWRLHRSRILKQVAWDVLTYAAPEAILQLQLEGRSYESVSGRNYEVMMMSHPILTKNFITYSCWWFWVSLGTAALLFLLRFVTGEKPGGGSSFKLAAVTVLWMAAIILYYVLQGAGIADYKYTVAAAELWIVLALGGIGRTEGLQTAESVAE